jgi:hypothetical protein
MNTTGIQNYLSNVFRPIYTYDTTTSNFTPRLELSNIDVYSGNTVSVFTAAVGDSNSNVYVGSNAGNPFNITRACRNITALGFGAASNISNDSNSVYIGYYAGSAGSNSRDVISIGTNSGGNGVSNIFIGSSNGTVGQNNILIGHSIAPSNVSNQVRIGLGSQIPIAADLCLSWVGLGGALSPVDANNKLDISGNTRIQGQLGINILPGGRTLDVNGNFRATDASGNILDFSNAVTRSTGGFASIQSNSSVTGGVQTIGQIKKGIIHVSTVNQASSADRAAYIYFAWTTSNVTSMSALSNGRTNITTSSTNIQITDTSLTTQTYDYSITYFPLP